MPFSKTFLSSATNRVHSDSSVVITDILSSYAATTLKAIVSWIV